MLKGAIQPHTYVLRRVALGASHPPLSRSFSCFCSSYMIVCNYLHLTTSAASTATPQSLPNSSQPHQPSRFVQRSRQRPLTLDSYTDGCSANSYFLYDQARMTLSWSAHRSRGLSAAACSRCIGDSASARGENSKLNTPPSPPSRPVRAPPPPAPPVAAA
jgi:hypothetical protein